MTKQKTIFICQSCGRQEHKWTGRCPDCGEWNSFLEERKFVQTSPSPIIDGIESPSHPLPLDEIPFLPEIRSSTGWSELDRILGGGLVAGSVILIGGDPGIGKSTFLLQVSERLSKLVGPVLYVSGEESLGQIRMRSQRLAIHSSSLFILSETILEKVLEEVDRIRPAVLIIDSIQTLFTTNLPSIPGSIGQVRETAFRIISFSKRRGMATFLIGHVTKEGAIAGPKVLEHMVDTVLYFEGEKGSPYRILRSIKNRFGSTNEVGIFEMKDRGLEEVMNLSLFFLSERPLNVAGSVVVPSLEGTRPILVEVQALVCPTSLGFPRRTSIGVDPNRISLLIAVLEKRGGMNLMDKDVFINVAGGAKIEEPAIDLGIVCTISSSYFNRPIDPNTVVFGEVGLTGEIRAIYQGELRVREAAKMGFERCILPMGNLDQINVELPIKLVGVKSVEHLSEILF
jgi:DNA repair protein RadA/Sms